MWLGDRQRERKRRTLAGGALQEPYVSFHAAHDLAAQIQTQSRAAYLAGSSGFQSGKPPEEVAALTGWDSYALIANLYHNIPPFHRRGHDRRGWFRRTFILADNSRRQVGHDQSWSLVDGRAGRLPTVVVQLAALYQRVQA